MKHFITSVGAAIITALTLPAAAQSLSKDIAGRIEAIPIQTLTVSDEQFLKGDAYGKPTTIAGVLAGRGIVSTVLDQSQLGWFNMILDLYRSLAVLASHPRVDPTRVAVMG